VRKRRNPEAELAELLGRLSYEKKDIRAQSSCHKKGSKKTLDADSLF
jgi:hypothetical protein